MHCKENKWYWWWTERWSFHLWTNRVKTWQNPATLCFWAQLFMRMLMISKIAYRKFSVGRATRKKETAQAMEPTLKRWKEKLIINSGVVSAPKANWLWTWRWMARFSQKLDIAKVWRSSEEQLQFPIIILELTISCLSGLYRYRLRSRGFIRPWTSCESSAKSETNQKASKNSPWCS